MDKASRTTCPLGGWNRRGPGCAIHKPIDVIARCGALRGDPRRHANERRVGWGREISPHEPGVMTDAGEHERDEPYNGPRDSSGPSIRDEEAPPPPHLKVTAFPRSAAPKDTRPDKAVHGRDDVEHGERYEQRDYTTWAAFRGKFSGLGQRERGPGAPSGDNLLPASPETPHFALIDTPFREVLIQARVPGLDSHKVSDFVISF